MAGAQRELRMISASAAGDAYKAWAKTNGFRRTRGAIQAARGRDLVDVCARAMPMAVSMMFSLKFSYRPVVVLLLRADGTATADQSCWPSLRDLQRALEDTLEVGVGSRRLSHRQRKLSLRARNAVRRPWSRPTMLHGCCVTCRMRAAPRGCFVCLAVGRLSLFLLLMVTEAKEERAMKEGF